MTYCCRGSLPCVRPLLCRKALDESFLSLLLCPGIGTLLGLVQHILPYLLLACVAECPLHMPTHCHSNQCIKTFRGANILGKYQGRTTLEIFEALQIKQTRTAMREPPLSDVQCKHFDLLTEGRRRVILASLESNNCLFRYFPPFLERSS